MARNYDTILILDFGSQYSHLITRRIRELGVYCELFPCTMVWQRDLRFEPKGVILSGGPASVFDTDAPHVAKNLFDRNLPVLGICYGQQEIAWHLGGEVVPCHTTRGYGPSKVARLQKTTSEDDLDILKDLPGEFQVWMSHGDQLSKVPPGFTTLATASSAPHAVIGDFQKRIYGLQFHPEVTHTPLGSAMLRNFVLTICQCRPHWTMHSFVDTEIARIRHLVGPVAHVVGAVSGGVDSTVAAVLMHRAIGHRFHCILVEHGLMRKGESLKVHQQLVTQLKIDLKIVDESDLFLSKLKGITDPEVKRKLIGNTFIHVFEKEAEKLGGIEFLLQGTLYPDVIESVSYKGPSATIKAHHNVGGLLDVMKLKLIEPLRELFKDEVRQLGNVLEIDDELIWRHPFPGPGLAVRILGEVTREQIHILQQADEIYMEEIKKAGLYRKIAQAFAVLLPIKSVGVMGDQRTYEQAVALRAVETTDFMTANWFPMPYDTLRAISSRIINEVKGVNRVVYDVSSKPPSTIEWE